MTAELKQVRVGAEFLWAGEQWAVIEVLSQSAVTAYPAARPWVMHQFFNVEKLAWVNPFPAFKE